MAMELVEFLKCTANLVVDHRKGTTRPSTRSTKLKLNRDGVGLDAVVISTGVNTAFELGSDLLMQHGGTLMVFGRPGKNFPFSFSNSFSGISL